MTKYNFAENGHINLHFSGTTPIPCVCNVLYIQYMALMYIWRTLINNIGH